jgi:hypothetical protein
MLVRVYGKDEKLMFLPDTLRYWIAGELHVESEDGYTGHLGAKKG